MESEPYLLKGEKRIIKLSKNQLLFPPRIKKVRKKEEQRMLNEQNDTFKEKQKMKKKKNIEKSIQIWNK